MDVDGETVTAEREVEGGHESITFPLPAVIAAQKGLNEPRYASLKGIMAAKKKPIDAVSAEDLGVGAPASQVEVLEVTQPSTERRNQLLDGEADQQVNELVRILHEEEKLI